MTVLLVAAGVLLLGVLALDVFVTVFVPEGHGGPFTRVQGRLLWNGWKALAPKTGKRKEAWLALGGPTLAVVAPASWALLLLTGFALIYYPWIDSFLVSPGSLRAPWTEVLYYSGFTAATLGTGDVVPDLPALRLLTIVEGLGGFALLSAALSYILAVYREHGRKTTLASELALHRGVRPDPAAAAGADGRDIWLEHVARELLHVTHAHAQYPILHYFRPRDPDGSLALQLASLLPSLAPDQGGPGSPRRGEALVTAALDRYLEATERRFVPDRISAPAAAADRRYLRLLRYLAYSPEDAGLRRGAQWS